MTSYTIELNESTKLGKAIINFFDTFLKGKKGVSLVENKPKYDEEFVKSIKEAEKRGSYTTIDPKNIWGSLGLESKN